MTVTRFDGTSLPPGWTAVQPTGGTVVVANGYAALHSVAGSDFDSLSGSVTIPEGPRITTPVAGAFDYAVGLANAANCATNQGIDLLGMDESAGQGIRFAQYVANISGRSTSWFGYRRDSGSAGNITMTAPPSNLYGPRSWMRLTWDGVDTWTFRSSHTGNPGTWATHATFTSTLAPTTFQLAETAFGPDANPREMRVSLVVDMAGRGDDATTDPGVTERSTILNADLGGPGLPPGLTAQTNAGGSVTVNAGDGYARLSTDTSAVDSYAWILGPDNLPVNHGLLMRYRFPQPSVLNAFAAPILRGAETTDLPSGSQVLPDKYRPGTGFLMEVNGSGSAGDIVRTLTAHPIAAGQNYDTNEFYGFSMMIEDESAPVDGSTGGWIWLRMEMIGGHFRVRVWLDGNPEPTAWTYEGEDYTQRGTAASVAWSHNDSTSGGIANFDISAYELYEIIVETVDPNALDVFVVQGGVEEPVTPYVLHSGIERPTAWSVVTTP